MTEQEAKKIVAARLAMDIMNAHCAAKRNPHLIENSLQICSKDREAAKVLGLTVFMNLTIRRVCGLNCSTCHTPIG